MRRPPTLSVVSTASETPVMLVHGWGGSFTSTWERNGFTALLEDAGRPVIGVDLLGHGTAAKPHDPASYTDLTKSLIDRLGPHPVDAIGFSLGALTLLRAAIVQPASFNRLVLAGIGRNVFERDERRRRAIIDALEAADNSTFDGQHVDPSEHLGRLFRQYADGNGNDVIALTAVMKADASIAITKEALATITCPVLVVVGDQDFVHPADELVDALPNATSTVLRNVDHFATPESFGFIDAALEFVDAAPG